MLAGTETLLTYETKITLTNKPKNLKFYWDSNKTQEIVVENERYLALNGFMSLEDNKKREIPIYWNWELETGNSQSEIDENDIIDSKFMGKTMSMQIDTTGMQVISNPYANGIASTTIDGNITIYDSVQDAIDVAGQNVGAVVTLLQDEINENVEINENQNIILDTNGKKLKSATSTVVNSGTLKITGHGTIESTTVDSSSAELHYIITNSGNLEFENATIYASSYTSGIGNKESGHLKINSGTINVGRIGINSISTLNTESNPAIIINNVTISSASNSITNVNGYVLIKNGSFTMRSNHNTPAIVNKTGKMKIQDATVRANTSRAVLLEDGNIEIINGTYTGASGVNIISGSAIIKGGTIEGSVFGINIVGGSLTLGTNEQVPNVDTTAPIIIGETSGIRKIGGVLNFYDGIIKVPTGNTLISAEYNNIPTGYHISYGTETIDGVEYQTAFLEKDE